MYTDSSHTLRMTGMGKDYSLFITSAGFMFTALCICQRMVPIEIRAMIIPAKTNIHHEMGA